ncbi:MAG: two-component regulator propeller domain-containing protein [Bacteroidales bacterium]
MSARPLMTFLVLALIIFSPDTFAQGIPLGSWREHLPYQQGHSVTTSGDKVYCGTDYAVFSVDKSDNSLSYLNTVTGLSDVGIADIHYHKPTETLIIAYNNANIDLVSKTGKVTNISDIYRKSITGKKTINKISSHNNLAYFSCGFGIVVMDMERTEIKDTYIIGPSATYIDVLSIAINDTAIYAATESGLYIANDYQNNNLLDYRSWEKDTNIHKPNARYSDIAFFQDQVFVINDYDTNGNDTIFMLSNGKWDYLDTSKTKNFYSIVPYDDHMMIVSNGDIDFYDTNLNNYRRIYTYVETNTNARDIIRDADGYLWIADYSSGLVKSEKEWHYDIITPNGPRYTNSVDMAYGNSEVWVATGNVNGAWGSQYYRYGVARFAEQEWTSYYADNEPAFDTIYDIMQVLANPADGDHIYAASWGSGIVEMKDGQIIEIYTDQNSTIEPRPQYHFLGVAGMTFDQDHNLWVTNAFVSNGLHMKTPDGQWTAFDLRPAVSNSRLGEVVIDDYGQKWISVNSSGGIIVFNDNNTYDKPGDDQVKRLNTSEGNGGLPSNTVMALAKDRDGEIWVGTEEGIAVFYSPGNVFSLNDFDAQQIFIPRNDGTNTGTYLLETETVTEILVDGANRKWIGTAKAGLFLMSPDGTEEIHHFTKDNSPLLSNQITSLTINNQTGELFIGTSEGIISYRTQATKGQEKHQDVYAYPNPVPPNFNGNIAINGLVTDANVKITDVSGNLIYQTIAKGGQAVWNGKNFYGDKAASGVYLVFSSNENGEETMVSKILFLR